MGPTIFLGFALLAQSITPINNFNSMPTVHAVNCRAYVALTKEYIEQKENIMSDKVRHLSYDDFVRVKTVEEYLMKPHLCQAFHFMETK